MKSYEVLNAEGRWRPCAPADVGVGDVFRMFEESGTPVVDEATGAYRWRCRSARTRDDGRREIVADPVPESDVEASAALGGWFPVRERGPGRMR